MHATPLDKPRKSFPLTLHPTGQWCKRIHGKLNYFGMGRSAAHERYLHEAANLHAGHPHDDSVDAEVQTVKKHANH